MQPSFTSHFSIANLATDEKVPTITSKDQQFVEMEIISYYKSLGNVSEVLLRKNHVNKLKKSLRSLPSYYENLDASRTWLTYWILHSLSLLKEPLDTQTKDSIVDFLSKCQNVEGGYGGGPKQLSHLAPTYAAINSLCILGSEYAFHSINRPALLKFLLKMKQKDGSFIMHEGGEVDIRGAYCALAVASLTNIICPELVENTAEWISSCQTYEGGFGGAPGMEAHGGYTFCGFASFVLLGKTSCCNVQSLLRWLVNRQMRFEGGFQGRTNKLVDSCYSFWQGGSFPLLYTTLQKEHGSQANEWLFDQEALQKYIVLMCQSENGGLRDKPGKNWDLYHTCYSLSGLSVAQNSYEGEKTVFGPPASNLLEIVDPIYNIALTKAETALEHFKNIPSQDDSKV